MKTYNRYQNLLSTRPNFKKENNPRWKGGLPHCLVCNKELITYGAVYCGKHRNTKRTGVKRPEHSKLMKGSKNPNFKGGKYYTILKCKDCNKKITLGSELGYCNKCGSRHQRIKVTTIKHHVYLKDNSNKTITLTLSKHGKLHNRTYEYIYEVYGKKGIQKYLKWFDKKYDLRT